MSDTTKAAYFLAALVAAFVLSWFVGALVGPWLDLGPSPDPTPVPHETEQHSHAGDRP